MEPEPGVFSVLFLLLVHVETCYSSVHTWQCFTQTTHRHSSPIISAYENGEKMTHLMKNNSIDIFYERYKVTAWPGRAPTNHAKVRKQILQVGRIKKRRIIIQQASFGIYTYTGCIQSVPETKTLIKLIPFLFLCSCTIKSSTHVYHTHTGD